MAQNKIAEKLYNKRVKQKSFSERDLVWKIVLPTETMDPRHGKWSAKWERPFVIHRVLGNGAYQLANRIGLLHKMLINGKYLKKYYPIIWKWPSTVDRVQMWQNYINYMTDYK